MTSAGAPPRVPRPKVIVVGLGPGDPGLISESARRAIETVAPTSRFVRTIRHPSAHLVEPATSFDDLYERATVIEDVYAGIVDALAAAAGDRGEVLYAVPGSPFVAERTVDLLRSDQRVEVVVLASLSFLDLAWARVGVDPVAAGVRLVDGHRFVLEAAGQAGPFLVAQCDSRQVLSEIKLSVDDGPAAVVLQRLGLADEAVTPIEWADLDRTVEPDHLTCVWIPALGAPVAAEVARLVELVRVLRERCPWDQRQTHQSLTRHLVEETYEVIEAIDEMDYAHLEEELGDLLFQVAFHANLAAEAGQFTMADVARGIHDKLVMRHPHVFEGTEVPNWEEMKQAEKGRPSVMDGAAGNLPALLYAYKVQGRAASAGFDWKSAAGAWPKILEELKELEEAIAEGSGAGNAVSDELGDVLFSVVNVARHLGLDPETALRHAAAKFRDRYVAMERLAAERGVPIDDALWDEVKSARRGSP